MLLIFMALLPESCFLLLVLTLYPNVTTLYPIPCCLLFADKAIPNVCPEDSRQHNLSTLTYALDNFESICWKTL
jgi:hypothetical protein